ncbi:MAG TPA: LegC family aminotransferase [Methylomirabilota bacterium]|nr:LegC family aminotransferase [Methylomirabilota bacterium]
MSDAGDSIPNAVPHLAGKEWQYVKECLDTNWVSSVGPFVDRFEREMAAYVQARHGIAVVTGTAALHAALVALDVRPDDEVLVPSLTFVATVNAIHYCGARPVFMDSDPRTWNLDPAKTAEFLARECELRRGALVNRASGRRVKAILPVHLYGHPVDLDPLLDLTSRYPVALVEDSTESLGARYKGKRVGVAGQVGCLSFNGNKIITTGGGGMVVTNDDQTACRLRSITTQARSDAKEWIHDEIGFNYRMTNIQAALGVAQLEQLDHFVESKRATARAYTDALSGLPGVEPLGEQPWAQSNFWMYSIQLDPAVWGSARRVIDEAIAAGIQCRPLFYPVHRQPPYRDCQAYRVEAADRLHARGLSLPCSVGITQTQRERVVRFLTHLK